jgi:predicted Zn finger-like uncharacterized protein
VEKIITQCPHCKAKFKLGDDKLGKKIRCPKCKGVFAVQELKMKPKPAPKPTNQEVPSAPQPPKPEAAPTPPVAEAPPAPPAQEQQPAPAAQEIVPLDQRPRPLKVKDFMETQHMRFIPEKAQGLDVHISYDIIGEGGGKWSLKIKDGTCEIKEGADPSAKTHLKMKTSTYLKIATKQLDGRVAFMLGRLKVKGEKAGVPAARECFEVANVGKNDIAV